MTSGGKSERDLLLQVAVDVAGIRGEMKALATREDLSEAIALQAARCGERFQSRAPRLAASIAPRNGNTRRLVIVIASAVSAVAAALIAWLSQ